MNKNIKNINTELIRVILAISWLNVSLSMGIGYTRI
jgi:hypothetical protein